MDSLIDSIMVCVREESPPLEMMRTSELVIELEIVFLKPLKDPGCLLLCCVRTMLPPHGA
ncbi:hypothetical protein AHAS_Ahas09G0130900 [Arachis hypogaea]